MNFRWMLLFYDGIATDLLRFLVCLNNHLIVGPLQQAFLKMTSHWRRRCLMALLVPQTTLHLGQCFQVLLRFPLCYIYLLLDLSSGMWGKVLETRLFISHILHSLLEFCFLSGISHRSILQINVIRHLLKVCKFWELSELWCKSYTDIWNSLYIHTLQSSLIPLKSIWDSSILRLHTSLARLIFKDGESFNWVFTEDVPNVLFCKHIHEVFSKGLSLWKLLIWLSIICRGPSPTRRIFWFALQYRGYLWRCIPTSRLALLFLLYSLHHLVVKLSLICISRRLPMPNFGIIGHDLIWWLKSSIGLYNLSEVWFLSLFLSDPQWFLKTVSCIDPWIICQPLKCQVLCHTHSQPGIFVGLNGIAVDLFLQRYTIEILFCHRRVLGILIIELSLCSRLVNCHLKRLRLHRLFFSEVFARAFSGQRWVTSILMTRGMGASYHIRLRVSLRLSRRKLISIRLYFFHENRLNVVFNLFVVIILGGTSSATRFSTVLPLQLLTLLLFFPLIFGNHFSDNPLCYDHSNERLDFDQALKYIGSLWNHSFGQEDSQIWLYQGCMNVFLFFKFHLLHKLKASIAFQNILDHWCLLIP